MPKYISHPRLRGCMVESLEWRTLLSTVPTGFVDATIGGNVTSPTAMDLAPDGRLFVTLQDGTIRVVKDNQLLATPFANLSAEVDSVDEHGLLGIALDPAFNTNHFVYLYYTAKAPYSHNRIARVVANGDQMQPGSETDLVEFPEINAPYHMGGAMHFGPDGKLYIGVGDHEDSAKAPLITSVFGKILRFNSDGTIPTDNPFYNQTTGVNRAIWAVGLRNPYTFAFQPGTGVMYIDDVGNAAWEEIDQGAAGANYGWPTTEGDFDQATYPDYTRPLYAYSHQEGNAITGGSFYNPAFSTFPAQYQGKYFFVDFTAGWMKTIDPATKAIAPFATGLGFPTDIRVGADGSMYYLSRGMDTGVPTAGSGSIHQIAYTVALAPVITMEPADQSAGTGGSASFSVSSLGTAPLSYQWKRDNVDIIGATSASYTLTNAQAIDNNAVFTCDVSNSIGHSLSNGATFHFLAGVAPTALIDTPTIGANFAAGDVISFSGHADDPEDGALPASAYTWSVDYFTGGAPRPHVAPISGITSGTFTIPTNSPYKLADVLFRITLSVTDSTGFVTTVTRDILPRVAHATIQANVPGLSLGLDGTTLAAPIGIDGVVNFTRTLSAPATQYVNNTLYLFQSWSDGGAATHDISFPSSDTTYTANYVIPVNAFLSDGTPTSATNGYGPYENDKSNGENYAGDGHVITLEGKTYAKGIGTHANSDLRYAIPLGTKRFISDFGIDDEVGPEGRVIFRVYLDDQQVFDSGEMTGSSATGQVNIDVAGKHELRLVVDKDGETGYDHADWAGATFISDTGTPPANVPPTANGDSAAVTKNAPKAINVLGNDADSDGTLVPGSVAIVTPPAHGSVQINTATGAITYTPALDYLGGDSFTYTVTDNLGAASQPATVTITVSAPANVPPTANGDSGSTPKNTAKTINVLANDTDNDGTLVPSSVIITTAPQHGTTQINTTTGAVTYTPALDYVGPDSFAYTVADNLGAVSQPATVSLTVTAPANVPPTANADSATTTKNVAKVVNVLANDTDSDGTLVPSSVVITTAPLHGTTQINTATGAVTYTPALDYVGPDSFAYTVADNSGGMSQPATVSLTVNAPANVPPTANADSASTVKNAAKVINILANDTDSDGTLVPSSVIITTAPLHGSTQINTTTGAVTYTPANNYVGPDSFAYTVADNSGGVSQPATVSLTVTAPANIPPTANGDSATAVKNVAKVIDILANDNDSDGALVPSSVIITTAPLHGTTQINTTTGAVTYTPANNYVGPDSFAYTVADNSGGVSQPATVTLTVNAPANVPPTANGDSATTTKNVAKAIDILANDTDSDGTLVPSSVVITTAALHGTTQVNATTGAVTYTPANNYTGPDSFAYTVADNSGGVSQPATVTLTVNAPPNVPPVANADSASTVKNAAKAISVLANDTDSDGTLVVGSVAITTTPSHGTVAVNATTGVVTYTPALDYTGPDSFAYTVADNSGGVSQPATVSLTVTAPVVTSTYLSTLTPVVISNGYGPYEKNTSNGENKAGDGRTITLNAVAFQQGLGVHAASELRYTVPAGASRFISEVGIDDEVGADGSVVFQVFLGANKLFDSSRMTGNSATQHVDVPVTPGQVLILIVTNAGDDQHYDHGDWADARFTSSSGTANVPPVANADSATTVKNAAKAISVLANDTDSDGTLVPASVAITTQPAHGGVAINATTGAVTYTPANNYVGPDSFAYTVADNSGGVSQPAMVSLTVTAPNVPPVANADSATTVKNAAKVISILTNDTDSDGTLVPGSVAITTQPLHGNVAINATTGAVTYTPANDYVGPDSFAYTVADNSGGISQPATVSLTITAPANVAPTAGDDSATTVAVMPVVISVLGNDSDSDGTLVPSSIAITTAPAHGSVSINTTTGAITYTPTAGYTGPDSFFYTVKDNGGATSNVAKVTLNVTAPTGVVKYLSDMTPTTAVNGYGTYEKDMSNGENKAGDGHIITLNGQTYAKGLGVHADSDLRFNLGKSYKTFHAAIGVDDEVGANGNVIFQVFADGVMIFQSNALTGSSATVGVDLNVANVAELKLVVLTNGAKEYDHADWADAQVST